MKGFLRRLRGIIATGLTWGIGFIAFFVLRHLVVRDWGFLSLSNILSLAIVGFIVGSLFAGAVILIEGRRSLLELSLKRVTLWGAGGGLVVLGTFWLLSGPLPWDVVFLTALVSGGLSSGSVALAQRSERKLLEGEEEAPPILEGE